MQCLSCSKSFLLTDPLTKLVRELQTREIFSSFYFPHFIGESSLEGIYGDFPKINKLSKLMSLPWLMEKPVHLVFFDYCQFSLLGPIWKRSWKYPRSSKILTGSCLTSERVLAPNRSVDFFLITWPTAFSSNSESQSFLFTSASKYWGETNWDLSQSLLGFDQIFLSSFFRQVASDVHWIDCFEET